MANWDIRSESEREAEAIEKHGKEEWNRRKAIVAEKCDELEKIDGWEARCVVGTQFEPIARAMKQELWDRFKTEPVTKWRRLVYKLAGVS